MVTWALFIFYMYVSFLDILLIIWYLLYHVNSLDFYLFLFLFPASHDVVQANFILSLTQ